jgi:ATPase subunit of ABC transporter with duplicated ATPase domains
VPSTSRGIAPLPGARVEPYDAPVIRRFTLGTCGALFLSLQVFLSPLIAGAQTPSIPEAERESQFVEALRREDPAEADRFVALNDARAQAITELRRAEAQYNAAGPELRSAFSAPLRRAQQKYAEASLALLDFFDARERRAVARYQEEIQRLGKTLEDRQRTRAELQKLLAP